MIDGILLINKEAGITSYDVIRRLKGVLPKGQKIGHAGTLDPFATGLLIILLGKCTKSMDSILALDKEYIVKAEFGYSTDTQDGTGRKINEVNELNSIPQGRIEEEIKKNFLGNILQLPPQFSAKKVKGKKAYEYARKGEKVKLKPRDIMIKKFDTVKYSWPIVDFKIVCSSGTYVRTLINDLGLNLKTFATAVELKRTKIGEFDLKNSLDFADIAEETKFNFLECKND